MAYQTVNPATNQLIKEYPSHTDADIEAALRRPMRFIIRTGRKATSASACRCCISLPI
jgi:acyl-CoA reductase-like NAD-dependent aldehyde dehydrogenase